MVSRITKITLSLALAFTGASAAHADILPVCERSESVQRNIVAQINQILGTQKTCADITTDDLLTLKRVAIQREGVVHFKVGDFSGLSNLEILNIRSNLYTSFPEGLFQGLDSLQTLVIIDTPLRNYPDDFLKDTPRLKHCHCFRNQVRTISLSVLNRLIALPDLEALDFDATLAADEKAFLSEAFPEGGPVFLSFE